MEIFINETGHKFHVTLMILRRLLGQRSTSAGHCRRKLVNAIAPEPLTGFEARLTKIFPTVGQRSD